MEFETAMLQMGNNTGIPVPADVIEALGGGKRPAVNVTVNGYSYRSTVGPMGGRFLIPFSSDKRAATGIGGGDSLKVELTLDSEPRTVDPPADFAEAMDANPGARAAFSVLSPSRQKAHVVSIEGAKTAETRERRIAAAVATLAS
ncbi:MAG: YdeI/OmpD-associated family protein [Lacisediminihabitans sp.]